MPPLRHRQLIHGGADRLRAPSSKGVGGCLPLDMTFARLYKSMADWRPPKKHPFTTCLACFASPFSDAYAIERLPHEVAHPFLLQLESVASQRLKDLEDEFDAAESALDSDWSEQIEDRAERLREFAEKIDEEIWSELARRTPEIEAARLMLIEPRLKAFLADETIDLEIGWRPKWLPEL